MSIDNEEIPAQACEPALTKFDFPSSHVIVFDLETTGLDMACDIVQIATCSLTDPTSTFSRHVLPTKPISPDATRITKLAMGRISGADVLLHDGKPVTASPWATVQDEFVAWLTGHHATCVLLAHNCFSFDARVLLHHASPGLRDIVMGFVDSLPALRKGLPDRASYSVSSLQVDYASNIEFSAHDAVSDVTALATVINSAGISREVMLCVMHFALEYVVVTFEICNSSTFLLCLCFILQVF